MDRGSIAHFPEKPLYTETDNLSGSCQVGDQAQRYAPVLSMGKTGA
jgi:hypothetical protein